MQKAILLISYVDERSIETRHHLLYAAIIKVSDLKAGVTCFLMQLNELLVLQKGNINL